MQQHSGTIPKALPSRVPSFIIARMFSSTPKESQDDSPIVWGAARRAVCALRRRRQKSHQQPSALGFDFSHHDARCLVLREQLLSLRSPETGPRAAAKAQPLPVPPGPLIVLRKVLGREGRVLSVHGPLPTNHPRRSMDIPHLSARAKDSFVLTLARVPKRHSSSGSASAPQVNILVSPPAITR